MKKLIKPLKKGSSHNGEFRQKAGNKIVSQFAAGQRDNEPKNAPDDEGSSDGEVKNKTTVSKSTDFKKAFWSNLLKSDPIQSIERIGDVELALEWPKGSIRKYEKDGVLKDGCTMVVSYGFIPGTTSPDGEELDMYLGDAIRSEKVFLLLQKPTPYDLKMGHKLPEKKYMLGFETIEEAEKAFKNCMPAKWFKSVKEITWEQFKADIEEAKIKPDVIKSVEVDIPVYSIGEFGKVQSDKRLALAKQLLAITKSETTVCGRIRVEAQNRIDRVPVRESRLLEASAASEDSGIVAVKKSIDVLVSRLNRIPTLVFEIN